jgi:hypothetical protein
MDVPTLTTDRLTLMRPRHESTLHGSPVVVHGLDR